MKNTAILLVLLLNVAIAQEAFSSSPVRVHYTKVLAQRVDDGIREIDGSRVDPVGGSYVNKVNGDELVINCQSRKNGECLNAHITVKYLGHYYSFYSYKRQDFLTIDFQSLRKLKKIIANTDNCYFYEQSRGCSYDYFNDQGYMHLSQLVSYLAIEHNQAYIGLIILAAPLDLAITPLIFTSAIITSIKREIKGATSKGKWKFLLKSKFSGKRQITDKKFDFMLRSVFTIDYSQEY
ncbi:hypothetical protein N9B72_01225 [Bacteriovoracaceae bacterium]|nr:hypothetical protein [Bacteriovoracaceae bacterium]